MREESVTWDLPMCSVIQGSQLSGLLFSCYVNEMNTLLKIVCDFIYNKVTGRPSYTYEGFVHGAMSFNHDTTNIISCKFIRQLLNIPLLFVIFL